MNKVYDIITEKIMQELQAGRVPWLKPWKPSDAPMNARGTRYTGINVFLLAAARETKGYTSNKWMTYNQAEEMGGHIKAEEHATIIIYASSFETEKDGKKEKKFAMRYYNVFNTEQTEGITFPAPADLPTIEPLDAAESVINAMQNKPEIKHGGDSAYYATRTDYVQMPPVNSFVSSEEYYAVLFHELGHSTGHASRLARFTAEQDHTFGSEDYSKEELIAEMTSAFLCGSTGITMHTENRTAYIQSWLEALNNDKTLVVKAASAAQKAADYIQNI